MCICNQESISPKPSSSAILHRERTNKVFGKRSSRLFARFIKFFITTRLPLRQSRTEGRRLQRELCWADRRFHPIVVVKELQVTYDCCSQIMSYLFNMLICVGVILLDNLLQYLMFISMIDIFRTYDTTATLIYNAFVIFIIIKIKLEVLIYQHGCYKRGALRVENLILSVFTFIFVPS
jgi:hypothetical protein